MCRHCERLVEDVQHKETVHAFMAAAAVGINRYAAEQGLTLIAPVTADDVNVRFETDVVVWGRNHLAEHPAVQRFIYHDLKKATE